MKTLYLVVLAFFMMTSSTEPESEVDGCDCKTPQQETLESWCTATYESLVISPQTKRDKKYLCKGKLFNGWACANDPTTPHQYLYFRFDKGTLVRKIGYFSNGNIDHDFSIANGKSMGCERMWRENGDPYVENHYISPGVKHGYQRRWHSDNQLAMIAYYEEGELIYQTEFDEDGEEIVK